jgi:hypothetical protein
LAAAERSWRLVAAPAVKKKLWYFSYSAAVEAGRRASGER